MESGNRTQLIIAAIVVAVLVLAAGFIAWRSFSGPAADLPAAEAQDPAAD